MFISRLRRIRLVHRLRFLLERQFVRGTPFQLLVVAALIGLISLVGGALVLPAAGDAAHLGEAVWWAFLRLSDPGYLGDDEGVWRRIVSTVLTVAGYVVFLGALVAIMTQWLNARMRQLESGLTPVATRNHVVVLGWSNRTLPVVSEILQSEGRVKRFLARLHASRLRLVVLSAEVTPWHVQTLRDHAAIGRRARHIVLRTGTPLVVDDLERVDCFNAAAVIIPSAGTTGSLSGDMATVKALLSLSNYPGGGARLPYVVAEIQDPRKVTVARRAYRGPLEIVSGSLLISRLMAQNLRHRGLSRVYRELLSHRVGCGFYVREHAGPGGARVDETAARYSRAVMCGVVRWHDGGYLPYLNPEPDFVLEADDRLVFVAPGYEDTLPDTGTVAPASVTAPARAPGPARDTGPRRILVLGWNRHVATLIHELSSYDGERFEITVASLLGTGYRGTVLAEDGAAAGVGVACRHLEVDYAVERELRELSPDRFDNIVLASSERLGSGEEADTRAVVAFLLLEALLDGVERRPHILLELQDPDNEPLLEGRGADVLVTPMILAHVVAQVALRRELQAVYEALFTAGGPELTLRRPQDYPDTGTAATFADLGAAVRGGGATLLGVYHARRDVLAISPPAAAVPTLEDGDELVVMT